ncbi:VacJ family lipoprotein [bacterium]|nr:VacJ family lipoprotein [bacterium]
MLWRLDQPLEPANRRIFRFNDLLDVHVLEPIARGWDDVVPDPVQHGFSNFFDNLRFPIVLVNDVLQGRPRLAVETIARFQCNTFLGGLGFVDLARDLGVPAHIQDTGLTFGRWGIPAGPFIMLPFFGPSNARDTVGFAADLGLAVYPWFITVPGVTVAASGIDVVNRRSLILDEVRAAKDASIDYYTFVRDAYTQRRERLVHGETPTSAEQRDELYDTEIYEDYMEEGN